MLELSGLMERLNLYRAERSEQRLQSVREFLGRVQARLPEFRAEERHAELHDSPRFNVFRILRLAHKEVQSHTPFLSELLNPHGTHGQGCLFLEAFLNVAEHRGLKRPTGLVDKARWLVDIELPAGRFGNLDIVVRSPALRFLLV